jgi:hypothetical protein
MDRVTDFGSTEIELLDGKKYRVRSLTFAEKKEYLAMIEDIKAQTKEGSNLVAAYLDVQIKVAQFLLSRMNPEITLDTVEKHVNGEVFKKVLEIAFYDPFQLIKL